MSSYELGCRLGGSVLCISVSVETGGRVPVLLPLRLGTGNAIADVAGASRGGRAGLAKDLARAASDAPARPLKLIEVDGISTLFAGVGLDADYAVDFRTLMKNHNNNNEHNKQTHNKPKHNNTAAVR